MDALTKHGGDKTISLENDIVAFLDCSNPERVTVQYTEFGRTSFTPDELAICKQIDES